MSRSHLKNHSADYSEILRSHMQAVGLSSFKALAEAAGVSTWQVQQLRQGKVDKMRLANLQKLSQALKLSLPEFLQQFTDSPRTHQSATPTQSAQPSSEFSPPLDSAHIQQLKHEYERLQRQLDEQKVQLRETFQQECLQHIESWLLQWPTAAHAAKQNPDVSAVKLLPLVRPIEQLLDNWGISAIATVGEEVPYDPQQHQLIGGTAEPGNPVRIRYVGYQQGDRLLYRAKVSPK